MAAKKSTTKKPTTKPKAATPSAENDPVAEACAKAEGGDRTAHPNVEKR